MYQEAFSEILIIPPPSGAQIDPLKANGGFDAKPVGMLRRIRKQICTVVTPGSRGRNNGKDVKQAHACMLRLFSSKKRFDMINLPVKYDLSSPPNGEKSDSILKS
jgi:hypothetical protein